MKWTVWRSLVFAALPATVLAVASAQDPFEIHVLQYETLRPAEFTLESHMNYVGKGTTAFDGLVAPTQDQFHMTYELTVGLTDHTSLGLMQLNTKLPGNSLAYAGWRLVPHFSVPRSWHWPLDVGLAVEVSFQNPAYDQDSRHIEILPIVEKRLGRFQIDFNPSLGRKLRGPVTRDGWEFEPAVRVGYAVWQRFTPSLEYYGAWGALPGLLPIPQQVHQFVSGGDLRLADNVVWSLGVGAGITSAGDRLVYKSRLEIPFGGRGRSH